MSPHRQARIERWQVAGAFVVLAIVFTITLFWQASIANQAKDTARKADANAIATRKLVKELARTSAEARAARTQQVEALHRNAIDSCRSRHQIVRVLQAAIGRGIRQARDVIAGPTGQLTGVAELERQAIRSSKQLLRDLRRADCTGIAPLPHTSIP